MAPRIEPKPPVFVTGVSGTGKTTIAKLVAARCGAAFVDADDHHPEENIRHMASGRALNDAMRWGWLDRVARAVASASGAGAPIVCACSALKRSYRDHLRRRLGPIRVVQLTGDPVLIASRMKQRQDHFMPASLLDSQFADLEVPSPDEGALICEISVSPEQIAAQICAYWPGLIAEKYLET